MRPAYVVCARARNEEASALDCGFLRVEVAPEVNASAWGRGAYPDRDRSTAGPTVAFRAVHACPCSVWGGVGVFGSMG